MFGFFESFLSLLDPVTFLIILLSSIVGIVLGAIPGLSGGLGVALLLPVTFGMEQTAGLAMLISVWLGGISGALVGSILLGIPGSPASIATCFDGYPMTRKGEAVRALSAGIIASFLGSIFSMLVAMGLSPVMADFALSLGPWEYFSLCFCAISLVAALSRESLAHGLAAASLGLLASCVGVSPIDGFARFTFGSNYLIGGLDLISLMLGLFALKQILVSFGTGQRTSHAIDASAIRGRAVSLKDFSRNTFNLIRSFFIGLWIGFLPGMGSAVSNLVAYAAAKSSSRHPEEFGKGSVDGVFASEVSNNAAVGGAVIPMIALGIPGDATTAVLLGGLIIHGINVGPLLITNSPDVVNVIFATAILASILVLVVQLFGMRLFPAILKVPYHYLYPAIVMLCFIGVFINTPTAFSFLLLLGFTVLGLVMDFFKLPVSPFLLAFILGPMLEMNLRNGMSYSSDGIWPFFTRPVSALLLFAAALSIFWPLVSRLLRKRA